jgi:hypothetical protein
MFLACFPSLLVTLGGSEFFAYTFIVPGLLLMAGSALGCGWQLRSDGYSHPVLTAAVLGVVLLVTYVWLVFVEDNEGLISLGVFLLPPLSPLLAPPSRALAVLLGRLVPARISTTH